MMRITSKLALLISSVLITSAHAAAQQVIVEANKSTALKINGDAASVVIGDPRVADVAVHDANLIFITGRTFGTTNLLIFNQAGKQLYSGDVVVTSNTSNLLSVNRAGLTNTYDCAPRCRSALAVGDEAAYFERIVTQNEDLQALAIADGGN